MNLLKNSVTLCESSDNIYKYIKLLFRECKIPCDALTISQVIDFEKSRSEVLQSITKLAIQSYESHSWKNVSNYELHEIPTLVVGLNTIGMLVDRLSILAIKGILKGDSWEIKCQVAEIIEAIKCCHKGHSSTFNKATTTQFNQKFSHPVDAILNLAYVNLLLWLAQDVLYVRGAGSLPNEELRDYIDYFAKKNLLRNFLISELAALWHS